MFYGDGDGEAASMTWKYFKREEFACKHCGENEIDDGFIGKLDELRERCGFPLPVTSGYRCPVYNQAVSSTGTTGPHTTGRASDLSVRGANALAVVRHALEMGFTGIGLNQKGVGRFVHLDDLPDKPGQPRPTAWTY